MINEISQLLSERAEKQTFPLDKPTLDDLVEVNEAMLISVPPVFREYLLSSSHQLYGRLEPVTIADPGSHTYLPEVAAQAWALGMPREYIPLCQDSSNIYCVAQDDTVLIWNEALGDELEEVSTNVWEWVRDIWLA